MSSRVGCRPDLVVAVGSTYTFTAVVTGTTNTVSYRWTISAPDPRDEEPGQVRGNQYEKTFRFAGPYNVRVDVQDTV